jgi:hypothetical protein
MSRRRLWIAIGLAVAVVAVWALSTKVRSRPSRASLASVRCYDEAGGRYSVGALVRIKGEVLRCNENGKFGSPPPEK